MLRRHVLAGFMALLLPAAADAQTPRGGGSFGVGWTKIPTVLVVSRQDNAQVQLVRDAVDFWNRTLAELGSPFRLGPVKHTNGLVPAGQLVELSNRVLGGSGPVALPDTVAQLPGDIVVALSDGDFVSFAARWPPRAKALVGIKGMRFPPLTLPNVARNVIAHEIGHAIGLGHNADATMLMCGRPSPCRPDAFVAPTPGYFPLTDAEKAALQRLYPATWPVR